MINERDYPVLRAFLEREANQFSWKQDGLELIRKSILVESLFRHITRRKFHGNYFTVESITNLGCLDAKLTLSMKNWSSTQGDIVLALGCTPKSLPSFYRVKYKSKGRV